MVGAFILQLRDTMSLIKADLGSVCVSEHGNQFVFLHPPQNLKDLKQGSSADPFYGLNFLAILWTGGLL